jgi:hypothetical protein
MSHAKQAPKRRGRRKAVTVLGVAGMLSLAGGASGAAVGPASDTPTENTAPVLLSVRKKSRMSAWRLSMSSTMKTPEHIVPAYNLPEAAAEAALSTEAAVAAQ